MEPNRPIGAKADQFDFINNASNGSPQGIKAVPRKIKLAALAGGVILILIIGMIVFNLFFKTPDNAPLLGRVAQQQARILQAAETGVDKARSQEARNLAITTQLSLIDDQKSLKSALSGQNVRVSTGTDEELEQELITAEQANQFDQFLTEYLQTELTSYLKNLDAAYTTTVNPDLKEVLEAQYKNAQFLAGESAER